jgi:uncharacterized membrane protein
LSPAAPDGSSNNSVSDADIEKIIHTRCVACHASQPTQPGFAAAPLGIVLQTQAQIQSKAERIAFTVQSKYMPIGNLTGMTDAERASIATWYLQQQK